MTNVIDLSLLRSCRPGTRVSAVLKRLDEAQKAHKVKADLELEAAMIRMERELAAEFDRDPTLGFC